MNLKDQKEIKTMTRGVEHAMSTQGKATAARRK
jgi:hypothetical protein